MTTISPEDEDIARSLMRSAVADIRVGYSLVDRVEAGVRPRRRRLWPLLLLPVGILAAGAAGFALTAAPGSRVHPDVPEMAQPVQEIGCAAPLPADWLTDGIPPQAPVDGDDRVLVPGMPETGVSCPVGTAAADGSGVGTQLPLPEERLLVASFRAQAVVGADAACTVPATGFGPLYFVFEYADGTQLSVVATPTLACGTAGPVIWSATNSVLHVGLESALLDSLGAAGAQG